MRTLLIDNYDSYTFNLYQLLAEVNGALPVVVRNDRLNWRDLELQSFDGVVFSPGPGHPKNERDFGICRQILQRAALPVLGVCLGHQGIADEFGGAVVPVMADKHDDPSRVYHGRRSEIYHRGSALLDRIPSPFKAVRYHSLVVAADRLPACLEAIAWTAEGTIMGLRHRQRPLWGVQFHPESICTEYGRQLLENFRAIALQFRRQQQAAIASQQQAAIASPISSPILSSPSLSALTASSGVVASALAGAGVPSASSAFVPSSTSFATSLDVFLDSADVSSALCRSSSSSLSDPFAAAAMHSTQTATTANDRDPECLSGSGQGTLQCQEAVERSLRVFFRRLDLVLDPEQVFVHLFGGAATAFWLDSSRVEAGLSRFSYLGDAEGPHSLRVEYEVRSQSLKIIQADRVVCRQESIFAYLKRELARRRCQSPALPFDFNGGFVGYFGYELKAECGAGLGWQATQPDAMFILADRLLVFDHEKGATYLLGLGWPDEQAEIDRWFEQMTVRLRSLPPLSPLLEPKANGSQPVTFHWARSRSTYEADIEKCLQEIRAGESYEICLTNQLYSDIAPDPLTFYRHLRQQNPAPYAAFLRWPHCAVACSSPERFLKIDRQGWVETKPIKGTARRGKTAAEDARLRQDLHNSEKDRAENLMVLDLLRNDLGRVCEIGSVQVPRLMAVETYATVHQLVSTVRGQLRAELDAIDCIRAAFPGGSMTGAPKLRTMEIIDRLEGQARGIYSGTIGFLALNGTADLNIAIRTAAIAATGTSIGVGGGIVALSQPELEVEEAWLKAEALMQAMRLTMR